MDPQNQKEVLIKMIIPNPNSGQSQDPSTQFHLGDPNTAAAVFHEEETKITVFQVGSMESPKFTQVTLDKPIRTLVFERGPFLNFKSIFYMAARLTRLEEVYFYFTRSNPKIDNNQFSFEKVIPRKLISPSVKRLYVYADLPMFRELDESCRKNLVELITSVLRMAPKCFPNLTAVGVVLPADDGDDMEVYGNLYKFIRKVPAFAHAKITTEMEQKKIFCFYPPTDCQLSVETRIPQMGSTTPAGLPTPVATAPEFPQIPVPDSVTSVRNTSNPPAPLLVSTGTGAGTVTTGTTGKVTTTPKSVQINESTKIQGIVKLSPPDKVRTAVSPQEIAASKPVKSTATSIIVPPTKKSKLDSQLPAVSGSQITSSSLAAANIASKSSPISALNLNSVPIPSAIPTTTATALRRSKSQETRFSAPVPTPSRKVPSSKSILKKPQHMPSQSNGSSSRRRDEPCQTTGLTSSSTTAALHRKPSGTNSYKNYSNEGQLSNTNGNPRSGHSRDYSRDRRMKSNYKPAVEVAALFPSLMDISPSLLGSPPLPERRRDYRATIAGETYRYNHSLDMERVNNYGVDTSEHRAAYSDAEPSHEDFHRQIMNYQPEYHRQDAERAPIYYTKSRDSSEYRNGDRVCRQRTPEYHASRKRDDGYHENNEREWRRLNPRRSRSPQQSYP